MSKAAEKQIEMNDQNKNDQNKNEQNKINKTDRKQVVIRLAIFVILSFLPMCIAVPLINQAIGEKLYVAVDYVGIAYAVGILGMLTPAIAHFLTRVFTKEGFDDIYMKLNIKGNVRYYLASFLVEFLEVFLYIVLVWRVFFPEFSIKEVFFAKDGIPLFLMQFAASFILIIPFFGEEWGWRGYMMPKLLQVTSKPVAILIGGIIWGLWHAPLTISGHNFGLDYKGFPYLGILFMCLYCTVRNAFMTLITERTKSILPACINHAMIDNLGAGVVLSMFASDAVLAKFASFNIINIFLVTLPIFAIVGVVSLILFCKK